MTDLIGLGLFAAVGGLLRLREVRFRLQAEVPALAGGPQPSAPSREGRKVADLALLGGRVLTADRQDRVAEALAVRAGRILWVGSEAEVKDLLTPRTRVLELRGKCAVPGFIDAHVHPLNAFVFIRREVDCRRCADKAELLGRIEAAAAAKARGEWVQAMSYPREDLPNRWELDRVAPDNPVRLFIGSKHASVFNSRALALANVDGGTPDPEGDMERDEAGEPTGLIRETLQLRVAARIPPYSQEVMERGLREVYGDFMRWGVTCVHDVGGGSSGPPIRWTDYARAHQALRRRGELPLRVRLLVRWFRGESLSEIHELCTPEGFGDDWVRFVGVGEIPLDGELLGRSAALFEPFEGEAENRGHLTIPDPEEVSGLTWEAHRRGLRITFHANGEAAIEMGLNAVEEALRREPQPACRHRIEHVSLPTREQIGRLASLGVAVTSSLQGLYLQADRLRPLLGERRMGRLLPFRSLLRAGVPVALGSDTMETADPLLAIASAVTRRSRGGCRVNGEEGLSVLEALRVVTWNGAWAAGEEDRLGSLEVGKLADLVVLSGDLLSVAPEAIPEVEVERVFLGGREVFPGEA